MSKTLASMPKIVCVCVYERMIYIVAKDGLCQKSVMSYEYDRKANSGSVSLFALKIDDREVCTNANDKIKASEMHAKLEHLRETNGRETRKRLGLTLKGFFS